MGNYTLAIFDLDGTILNTLDDLVFSVSGALEKSGLPLRTADEVRMALGRGFDYLIAHCVPEGTAPEVTAQVLADFQEIYAAHCMDKTRPYDGVLEAAREIRAAGVHTAVLSNKGDAAVQDLAADYFPNVFEYTAGEKPGIRRKPEPDAVYAIMERFGATKESTVYIGDSDVDVATGRNSACGMVAVSWGFRTKELLVETGAPVIVDTPQELVAAVLGVKAE